MEVNREEQVRAASSTSATSMSRFNSEAFVLHCSSQEKTKIAVNLNKSREMTRAHLQGQLRNKEAENNRLTVQLRVFDQTRERACHRKCRIWSYTLSFPVFGENPEWAKDGDQWFKVPYSGSEEGGRKGTRISEESLPSTEAESSEVWRCDWEMLRWTEREGSGLFLKSALSMFLRNPPLNFTYSLGGDTGSSTDQGQSRAGF